MSNSSEDWTFRQATVRRMPSRPQIREKRLASRRRSGGKLQRESDVYTEIQIRRRASKKVLHTIHGYGSKMGM